jgi:hypothetical protein
MDPQADDPPAITNPIKSLEENQILEEDSVVKTCNGETNSAPQVSTRSIPQTFRCLYSPFVFQTQGFLPQSLVLILD